MKENILQEFQNLKQKGFYNFNETITPVNSSVSRIQIISRQQAEMIKSPSTSSSSSTTTKEQIVEKIKKRHEYCQLHFSSTKQLFENSYTNVCKSQNTLIEACAQILSIEKEDQTKLNQNHDIFKQCEELSEKISSMNDLAKQSLLQFQKGIDTVQSFSNVKQINIPIGIDEVISLKILLTNLKENITMGENILQENEKKNEYNDTSLNSIKIIFPFFLEATDKDIAEYTRCIDIMNNNRIIYDTALAKLKIDQEKKQNAITQYQHSNNSEIQQSLSKIRNIMNTTQQSINQFSTKRQEESGRQKEYIEKSSQLEKQKAEFQEKYQNFLNKHNDKRTSNCKIQNENTEILKKWKNQLSEKECQEQNIKNVLQIDNLIDLTKLIKWNNEVQTLHNKLECRVLILQTYYKLCVDNTEVNLKKIKNLIEMLTKKRQELLKEQEEQILSSLHQQIIKAIRELFNDLQEQQKQFLEETLEQGGQELIKYIAQCQADDQIFKELNLSSDLNKISKLKEFISEQCRNVVDKQLVEMRDMFVSNMKPLSIADNENPLSFMQEENNNQQTSQKLEDTLNEEKQKIYFKERKSIPNNSKQEKKEKQKPKQFRDQIEKFREQIKNDKRTKKGINKGMEDFEIKISNVTKN